MKTLTTTKLTTSALALAISLGLASVATATPENQHVREPTMEQDRPHAMGTGRQSALEARVGSAEAKRLHAQFRQLDSDGDGIVLLSELDAGEREKLERFDADDDRRLDRYEFEMAHSASFDALDTDGDGALSRSEVDAVRPEWVSFVALDSDNDQSLSEQEYRTFIESGDWVQDQHRYAFEYVDLDGDGFVNESEAEVFVPLSSSFTAVDTDGDGIVDRTQYQALITEIELEQRDRVAGNQQ